MTPFIERARIDQWRLVVRHANRPSGTRLAVRFVSWCVLGVLAALMLVMLSGSRAHAATDSGIPLIDVCAKDAPYPALPTQGLPGLVGERPLKVTNDSAPEHIWSTGGFGGLQSHPYDLGCALDPTSWAKITSANTDATVSNGLSGFGQTVTSLTDSMDRRAWQPGYVISFMQSFLDRALGTVQAKILYPLLGAGILLAAVMVAWKRSGRGDMSGAARNFGWVLTVLTLTSFLMASPLALSALTQQAGSSMAGALSSNVSASDGATNAVTEAVHYQGWLRRTFGSESSEVATTYGPELLASQRFTWTEYDTANRLHGDARGDYLKGLVKRKSASFKDIADKVKDADPIAYRHLTGQEPGSSLTVLELVFAGASSAFRLAVDLLVVLCVIMLVMLGLIWVIATPWLVTPNGQQMGMGLVNNGVAAVIAVGQAVLCAWLFTIYLQATMAPGMSAWWSLLLLLLGMSAFWIALAPFHKMGMIVSLGRMDGTGKLMGFLKTAALAYVTGRIAGGAAGRKVVEETKPQLSEDEPSVPLPPPPPPAEKIVANIYNPGEGPDLWSHTEHYPNPEATLPSGPVPLPSGQPYYQRGDEPAAPPPEDATTAVDEPYEPYQRTDDSEGADSGRA